MKKLFSIKYTAGAVNVAMLILRVSLGTLMIFTHGYQKLTHFNATAQYMPNLLGMGSTVNTTLIIFAEFFCALFIVLGLFTRFACVPLIIAMGIALFKVHHFDVFGKGELPSLFLIGFFTILLIGPGKISVDGMIK